MHFDDLMLEKSYTPIKAYQQSKLANILFTKELSKKLKGNKIFKSSVIYIIKLINKYYRSKRRWNKRLYASSWSYTNRIGSTFGSFFFSRIEIYV